MGIKVRWLKTELNETYVSYKNERWKNGISSCAWYISWGRPTQSEMKTEFRAFRRTQTSTAYFSSFCLELNGVFMYLAEDSSSADRQTERI